MKHEAIKCAPEKKLVWTKPKLTRLEPTPELVALFNTKAR